MSNNTPNSNPNLQIFPFSPPIFPNSPLLLGLSSSYDQSPRKKRTKITKIDTSGTASSSTPPKSNPRPKYSKKPDPNAPKITRPCTECGKKFWSWKALFGHMRCHPERQWRGINPPPNYRRSTPSSSTSKRERPNWVNLTSEQDQELASCLLILANSTPSNPSNPSISDRFECGGCKKVFGSHQALGGHRASHKNVKGCFAITNVNEDLTMVTSTATPATTAATTSSCQEQGNNIVTFSGHHKCSICFRVFTSGQALGGHMRCHWEREEEQSQAQGRMMNSGGGALHVAQGSKLDLNKPATVHDSSSSTTTSSCFSDTSGCCLDLRLGL